MDEILIKLATWIALTGFGGMAGFQLMLALGMPWGHLAWGGIHRKLPVSLRWGSAIAIGIFMLGIIVVLDVTGRTRYFVNPAVPVVILWVLTGIFGLSTLGNLMSRSPIEKKVMTPVAILLFASCLTLALVS